MVTLTIDGKKLTVDPNKTIIQAADEAGIEIPRYCYHPGLTIAGNCRICLVDVEKQPKLTIACNTRVAEGMVVYTQNEKVKAARQGVLEFLLANHPLDCPVCDQSGECFLQDYYMKFGLYDARFQDQKVKKHKAIPVGPTVMLDSERCILCSRCVRFTDEISKTHEFGIFGRGDHEEVGLVPGKTLDNPYSGNVVDICPVGALTDRDFRFKCRVWFLGTTPSVCPGCSNGCNIEIHVNKVRPYQTPGERVMRLKPRFNAEVNGWWICDEGRYGYKFIDKDRLKVPQARVGGALQEISWEEALKTAADFLKNLQASGGMGRIGVIPSPKMTNEDLLAVRKFFKEALGVRHIDFAVPEPPGFSDNFLLKADKNPNTRGAQDLGLAAQPGTWTASEMLDRAARGELSGLWVFQHDLVARFGREKVEAASKKLELFVFQGTNLNGTLEFAGLVLPSAVYAEKEGTFTNFAGRVQKIHKALEPLGKSKPDEQILLELASLLLGKPLLSKETPVPISK